MVVMSHFALGQLIVMALERADTALKHKYFPPELERKALKLSPPQGSHGSGSCWTRSKPRSPEYIQHCRPAAEAAICILNNKTAEVTDDQEFCSMTRIMAEKSRGHFQVEIWTFYIFIATAERFHGVWGAPTGSNRRLSPYFSLTSSQLKGTGYWAEIEFVDTSIYPNI